MYIYNKSLTLKQNHSPKQKKSKQQKQGSTMSERIDTSGTTVKILPDGKLQIFLDKRVTPRAFSQVLEYLYTDRVSWDKDTDKGLISETKEVLFYYLIFLVDCSYNIFCRLPDIYNYIVWMLFVKHIWIIQKILLYPKVLGGKI